ncbi:MAG: molecular chaperone TorD family protein [Firmicutes bacterium]|nr:molecular chaperone TorD family protein [Bacillota bacterium]
MDTLGPVEDLANDIFVEVTDVILELVEQAVTRSRVYRFLTDAYVALPDENLVFRLLGEKRLAHLAGPAAESLPADVQQGLSLIWSFGTLMGGRPPGEIKELLSVDRTRLFRGLMPGYGPPPPYESVYVGSPEAPLFQITSEVAALYVRAGARFSWSVQEQADYIGVETDFMRLLTKGEAVAWKESPEEARRWLSMEQEFLRDHLLRWVPRFCEIVIREAESDFYRGVAMLTRGFLAADLQWVNQFVH